MLFYIIRFIAFILTKTLFRVSCYGRENIPKKGKFILAANHVSYLDPIVLSAFCPRVVNFMARQSLFKNRFFGWFITHLNAFPLKKDVADLGAMREALKRLNSGEGLIMFPAGTRAGDGREINFREGIGFLSTKTSTVIIPACIKGSDQALPRGSKRIFLKKISIYFGKPIEPKEFNKDDSKQIYNELTRKTFEEVTRLGKEIK